MLLMCSSNRYRFILACALPCVARRFVYSTNIIYRKPTNSVPKTSYDKLSNRRSYNLSFMQMAFYTNVSSLV